MKRRRLLRISLAVCALGSVAVLSCSSNWCTTFGSSFVCDDFDKSGGAPQEGLPQQSVLGEAGGALVISNQTYYTPPNSALLTTNSFEAGAGSGALLTGPVLSGSESPPSTLTCQLQMQAAQLSTVAGDTSVVFTLRVTSAAGAPFADLSFVVDTQGNISFVEQYASSALADGGGPVDSGGVKESGPDGPSESGVDGALRDGASPTGDGSAGSGVPDAHGAEGGGFDAGSAPVVHSVGTGLSVEPFWAQLQVQLTQSSSSSSTLFSATFESQTLVGTQSVSGTLAETLPAMMGASIIVGPVDSNGESTGWSFFFDDVVCY